MAPINLTGGINKVFTKFSCYFFHPEQEQLVEKLRIKTEYLGQNSWGRCVQKEYVIHKSSIFVKRLFLLLFRKVEKNKLPLLLRVNHSGHDQFNGPIFLRLFFKRARFLLPGLRCLCPNRHQPGRPREVHHTPAAISWVFIFRIKMFLTFKNIESCSIIFLLLKNRI